MRYDTGFLLLMFLPVILLAVWAGYALATRRARPPVTPPPRDDSSERPELTGREQHKRRHLS